MGFNIGSLESRFRAVKERCLKILKNKFPNELFINLEILMYERPEEFEHNLGILESKVRMEYKYFNSKLEFNASNFFKSYTKIEKALISDTKKRIKSIDERLKRDSSWIDLALSLNDDEFKDFIYKDGVNIFSKNSFQIRRIAKRLRKGKYKKFNPKTSSDYSKKPSKNLVYKKKKSDESFIQLEKAIGNLEYRFKIVKRRCLRLLRKYFPRMLFEYLEKMMYEDPEEFEYYFKILEKGILSIRHETIKDLYSIGYWDIATEEYGDYLRNTWNIASKHDIKRASARAKQVDSWCRRILSKTDNELRKWINSSDKKSSSSQIQGTRMIQKLVKRIRRVRKKLRWYY